MTCKQPFAGGGSKDVEWNTSDTEAEDRWRGAVVNTNHKNHEKQQKVTSWFIDWYILIPLIPWCYVFTSTWEDVVQNETDGSATVVIMTLGIAGVTSSTSSTRHPRHPTSATAIDASDTSAGATVVCLPSTRSTRCVVHLETKSSKSLESLESLGPSGLVLRYSHDMSIVGVVFREREKTIETPNADF